MNRLLLRKESPAVLKLNKLQTCPNSDLDKVQRCKFTTSLTNLPGQSSVIKQRLCYVSTGPESAYIPRYDTVWRFGKSWYDTLTVVPNSSLQLYFRNAKRPRFQVLPAANRTERLLQMTGTVSLSQSGWLTPKGALEAEPQIGLKKT